MKGNYEPAGYRCSRFIDGKIRDCVLVTGGDFSGWFCYRHPDGQFVSLREATQDERNDFGFTPEPKLPESKCRCAEIAGQIAGLEADNAALRAFIQCDALWCFNGKTAPISLKAEYAPPTGPLTHGPNNCAEAHRLFAIALKTTSGQQLLDRVNKMREALEKIAASDENSSLVTIAEQALADSSESRS